MAKVSRATIHLCQITSRSKSDGTYPIVLRVQYNGRAEKYTSVSVPISAWDSKNECVKKYIQNEFNNVYKTGEDTYFKNVKIEDKKITIDGRVTVLKDKE